MQKRRGGREDDSLHDPRAILNSEILFRVANAHRRECNELTFVIKSNLCIRSLSALEEAREDEGFKERKD